MMKNSSKKYKEHRTLTIHYKRETLLATREMNESFKNIKSEDAVRKILGKRAKQNMKKITYAGRSFDY